MYFGSDRGNGGMSVKSNFNMFLFQIGMAEIDKEGVGMQLRILCCIICRDVTLELVHIFERYHCSFCSCSCSGQMRMSNE